MIARRRRRLSVVVIALASVLCLSIAPPISTEAAWTDKEVASSTLTAGTVNPATGLNCTGGLLTPLIFKWNLPTGGLPRSGFRWTVTGSLSGSGVLAADATQVTLTGLGILSLGSGTFTLYSVGPGGWESKVPVTGSLFAVSVLGLGVLTSCDP